MIIIIIIQIIIIIKIIIITIIKNSDYFLIQGLIKNMRLF